MIIRTLVLMPTFAITARVIGAPIQYRLVSEIEKDISGVGEVKINGNLTTSGRISTDEYVHINGVANEGSECFPNGLVGQDGKGQILSCQRGAWSKPKISTTIRRSNNRGYRWPSASVSCASHEQVVGGGGECHQPSGYIWLLISKPIDNGWTVVCDGGLKNEWGTADVWAVCVS